MSKFEILYKYVCITKTILKFYRYFVREARTKHWIFCAI